VEAYNLYLKARYQLFRSTPEGVAKSKEYYEQAIALDPDYALAWHGLAGFYSLLGMFGQVPPKAANRKPSRLRGGRWNSIPDQSTRGGITHTGF
jgi:tetratricopeptide (TPR) repeat protein